MDELPFEEWMRRVDATLVAAIGVASDCLPDCPYSEWHEAGATPRKAATLAVRRIDGPRDSIAVVDEPIVTPPARAGKPPENRP